MAFQKTLDALPHPDIQKLPGTPEPRSFFTDGSAFGCGNQQALLCSWSVTEATPMSKDNVIRSNGFLPGRKHTVFALNYIPPQPKQTLLPKMLVFCTSTCSTCSAGTATSNEELF